VREGEGEGEREGENDREITPRRGRGSLEDPTRYIHVCTYLQSVYNYIHLSVCLSVSMNVFSVAKLLPLQSPLRRNFSAAARSVGKEQQVEAAGVAADQGDQSGRIFD
jgi:hypothetical protein